MDEINSTSIEHNTTPINSKQELESKLFMMFISSILLLGMTIIISLGTLKIKDFFSFTFPEHTIFIHDQGLEEYNIERITEKLQFVLSAASFEEAQYYVDRIVDVKDIKQARQTLYKWIQKENLLKKNVEILNVTKIYGNTMKINGNNTLYEDTNSNFTISMLVQDLKNQLDKKFLTLNIIFNNQQEIIDFKYYVNDSLKEFYEAQKLTELLSLRTLPKYVNEKVKDKISIRNLFVKPTGTSFIVQGVELDKEQVRILVKIDNKDFALIYKNGEIMNVIELVGHEKK